MSSALCGCVCVCVLWISVEARHAPVGRGWSWTGRSAPDPLLSVRGRPLRRRVTVTGYYQLTVQSTMHPCCCLRHSGLPFIPALDSNVASVHLKDWYRWLGLGLCTGQHVTCPAPQQETAAARSRCSRSFLVWWAQIFFL